MDNDGGEQMCGKNRGKRAGGSSTVSNKQIMINVILLSPEQNLGQQKDGGGWGDRGRKTERRGGRLGVSRVVSSEMCH